MLSTSSQSPTRNCLTGNLLDCPCYSSKRSIITTLRFPHGSLSLKVVYAVGSPLPLILTMSSADSEALELLSDPSSIRIDLIRHIAHSAEPTESRGSKLWRREFAGRAVLWPCCKRTAPGVFHGEVGLDKHLKPSFVFPRFAVRVSPYIRILDEWDPDNHISSIH